MKIIAETAFNHNGNYNSLKDLLLTASKSEADFATIQIFDAPSFCEKKYERYDIYKKTSFSQKQWQEVFNYCEQLFLEIIPCPLDLKSLEFCYDNQFKLIKIHATDLLNIEMLKYISDRKDIKILLETQCATKIDIDFCMSIISDNVECIFHGFSDYPTELKHIKLNALDFLKEHYNKKVGFADHTLDTKEIPLMCLAKGVEYLEKHITTDRSARGYDWQVSLELEDFKTMVTNVKKYEKCLGDKEKHPSRRESSYRGVMYKKFIDGKFIRSDKGSDLLTMNFDSFKKENAGIALIARLKSKRLRQKVLLPFKDREMIVDLYNSLKSSGFSCYLATSNLKEDLPLIDVAKRNHMEIYRGDPVSVLDRMLSLSFENKWGAVFRVTGDNPFTNINLIKKMKHIMVEQDLDYVRVNGVPFGISAELFSTSYLWKLYRNLETTSDTEYLSWFVLNDRECKKGCINVKTQTDWRFVNYSIDYKEDYERCKEVIKSLATKDLQEITLSDLLSIADLNKVNKDKEVKLPQNVRFTLENFLSLIESIDYQYVEDLHIAANSIIDELENGKGFVHMKNLPLEDFTQLSKKVGSYQPQNHKKETIVAVSDRGIKMSEGGRYHQSNEGGSIHTDSPHRENVVDYVALYCESPSFRGGETLLCSCKEVYDELVKTFPQHVETLEKKFYFDKKEYKSNKLRTIFKPILFTKNNTKCFRYLRDYIESGYEIENKQLNKSQLDALNCLDELVKKNVFEIKLQKNDAIIFNNFRMLHGRKSFVDNKKNIRNLKRIWLCKH